MEPPPRADSLPIPMGDIPCTPHGKGFYRVIGKPVFLGIWHHSLDKLAVMSFVWEVGRTRLGWEWGILALLFCLCTWPLHFPSPYFLTFKPRCLSIYLFFCLLFLFSLSHRGWSWWTCQWLRTWQSTLPPHLWLWSGQLWTSKSPKVRLVGEGERKGEAVITCAVAIG